MTIPSTPSEISYAGDNVSTVFPITFVFDTAADLKLITTDSSGNIAVLSAGFIISGGGGLTGSCTLSAPLALGYTLTILDNPLITQNADYVSNDPFPAKTHERALDRGVRISKRLSQLLNRTIHAADGDPISGADLALGSVDQRKGKYLFFNALTGAIEYAVGVAVTALSQSIIAQLLNPQTDEELAAGINPTNYWYWDGHVRRYNAKLDGVTDDTAAFQRAWKLLNPYAPAGVPVITASIPIIAGQQARLDGTAIKITGGLVKVFTATAVDDWSIRGRWSVTGDNDAAGSLAGTAAALQITDCERFHVDAPAAKSIRGWGVLVSPGASTSARGEKGTIVAPHAFGCYRGFEAEAGTGAEYINVVAPVVTRCNVGMRIGAGNISVDGGSIIDNTTGVLLVNGANHGHGIFNGTQISHNTTNVDADTVTNGHTFDGCHIYEGIIHLNHSTGVMFESCFIDVTAFRFEESDGCGFVNCRNQGSYANTIQNDYNGTHSFTVWNNCKDLLGRPFGGALGNIKGVRVTNSLAANQVFSAANVNATSVIKLDDAANSSANQLAQTTAAYDAYSAATGVFTVVKGDDGKVRLSVQLVASNNAADTGKFQCLVRHSVLGDFYMASEVLSTTSVIFRYEGELPSDLTNTLQLMITGTGVANNVTIANSAGTKAQVEGL